MTAARLRVEQALAEDLGRADDARSGIQRQLERARGLPGSEACVRLSRLALAAGDAAGAQSLASAAVSEADGARSSDTQSRGAWLMHASALMHAGGGGVAA